MHVRYRASVFRTGPCGVPSTNAGDIRLSGVCRVLTDVPGSAYRRTLTLSESVNDRNTLRSARAFLIRRVLDTAAETVIRSITIFSLSQS